ncbi:hypothetical protein ACFWVP_07425 [Streptomyces sp. NPDC058637]|uniref:hypothetical protein n=1 Tax=Streptomyces sp. NPDC058637 TaxID=3346569 RepID=UPI00364DB3C6
MADEQDEWLDADAAETLLRGESVEPVDDHSRAEARQLEAALREVRAPGPSAVELPGEATALAAFREASVARTKKNATAPSSGPAGQQDTLHTVRIGAVRAPSSRRPRWTRPVRYGLAVSLAGFALGGVAVAAGTGMLPAPFGGQGSSEPASSVSVAASPEELGAGVPEAGGLSPAPTPPDVSSPPATPEGAGEGTAPDDDGRGGLDGDPDGSGTNRRSGDPESTGDPDGPGDGTDAPGARDGTTGGNPSELYVKAARACRDYRNGELSREDERRLIDLADGERNLDRFCDRVLKDDTDGSGGSPGGGSSSGGSEGGSEGGKDGGSEGGKDKGEDGEQSLPSISFRTPPPQDDTDRRSTVGDPARTPSSALSSAPR